MNTPVILAVDDQEHIRKMLSVALEICGYHVVTARDGVDALKHLASQRIDLLLTDWSMPVMGGAELTRHVCKEHQELPIVVVSCYSTPPSKSECSSLGIDHWVKKPFHIKDIQNIVTDTLNDRQIAAELHRHKAPVTGAQG